MTTLNSYPPSGGAVFPPAQAAKVPVRVTGSITADDAIESLKAVGKWRTWRISLIVLPLLVLITLATLTNRRRRIVWPVPIATITAGVLLMTAPLRAKRRFVRSWNNRPDYHHPISWTFSHEGLLTETINSKTLRDWSGFVYAKITPERIVLAQPGDMMFSFVPRRLFSSDGEWTAACQLLAAKLPVRGLY
jgi:hypothetical protein